MAISFLIILVMLTSDPSVMCASGGDASDYSLDDQEKTNSNAGLRIGGRNFQPNDIAAVNISLGEYDQQPAVTLIFSDTGNAKFIAIQKGRVGKELPIFVDGRLVMCPVLRERILGGQVTITGAFNAEEASSLANKLKP